MSILTALLSRCLVIEHLDIQLFVRFSLNDFDCSCEFNESFN
jgi:hypothetical protein